MKTKMILRALLLPLLLLPLLSGAQVTKERDVAAAAGDYSTTASLQVSWTVGEPATDFRQSASLIVTEGFQQADTDPTGVEKPQFPGEISVYPNPVVDILHFEVHGDGHLRLRGELYDLSGRRVKVIPDFTAYSGYRGQVDVSNLPTGKWLLRFIDTENHSTKAFTITRLQ